MSSTSDRPVGIAWFKADRYEQTIAGFVDGVTFPKTHAGWRLKAGRMERQLKRQGLEPVRVELDPARFANWCAEHDLAADSAARERFVRERMAEMLAAGVPSAAGPGAAGAAGPPPPA